MRKALVWVIVLFSLLFVTFGYASSLTSSSDKSHSGEGDLVSTLSEPWNFTATDNTADTAVNGVACYGAGNTVHALSIPAVLSPSSSSPLSSPKATSSESSTNAMSLDQMLVIAALIIIIIVLIAVIIVEEIKNWKTKNSR